MGGLLSLTSALTPVATPSNLSLSQLLNVGQQPKHPGGGGWLSKIPPQKKKKPWGMKTRQKNKKSLILKPLMSNRWQDQDLKCLFLGFETVSTAQSIHK